MSAGRLRVTAAAAMGIAFAWCAGPAAANPADDARYLADRRLAEAVVITDLDVRQGTRPLALYDRRGYEERRADLKRRPMLAPAQARGRFQRGIHWTVRVDRRQALDLSLACHLIVPDRGSAAARTVDRIWVQWSPTDAGGETVATPVAGRFRIRSRSLARASRLRLKIVTSRQQHHITIDLLDEKRPVTLLPS